MSLATSSFLRTIIKAVENHLNQRLPRYKRGVVVGQASDPMKILVAPSGENGVADLFEYPILRPYTSATVGDPGGPALDDDLLILETTPNNPVINGQLLTNPNDKPNRDGYPGIDKVSITQNDAKKLRAHAIVVDHVPPVDGDVPATARDGMLIVSTFDNSLWKRVSGTWYQVGATKWGAVVDPDGFIDVWIAASVTLPTDGTGDQTAHTTPGYTPTVYNTSALGLDGGAGHAAYVKHDQKSITQTADGKLRAHDITITHSPPIDADVPGTARDGMTVACTNDNSVWERSSGTWHRLTLPLGGTTGQALAKVSNTDYDISWQTISGGGGGGGWTTGVAMLATGTFHQIVSGDVVGGIATGIVTWNTPPSGGNNDFDTGSYFDPAHPTRLTVQVDGIYELAGQIEFRTNVAGDAFIAYAGLNKNGSEMGGSDLLPQGISSSNPVAQKDTSAPISIPLQCLVGDYFELEWNLKPGTLGAWINGSSTWFSIKQVG